MWSGPKTQALFCQGIFASQAQATKYTEILHATTGQEIIASPDCCLPLVQSIFIGNELDEVVIGPSLVSLHDRFLAGIISSLERYRYGYKDLAPSSKLLLDATWYSIDFKKMNFAQSLDISCVQKKYSAFIELYPDELCIFFGVSRGAAAMFNALALHKYPAKLVILESCYDSIPSVLEEAHGKFSAPILSFLSRYTSFDKEGISPLSSVEQFPAGIPVVFVTSLVDKKVPYVCTQRIAKALAAKKQNDVYFITLKQSAHSNYTLHTDDGMYYRNVMHAIYQKYNLAHIEEYAEIGKQFLEGCLISKIL